MQGRVVVVTGAFGALGQVVVEVAAARGAATAAIGKAAAPPLEVAKRFAPTTLVVGGVDLTSPEQARTRWPRSRRGSAGSTRWSTSPARSSGKRSKAAIRAAGRRCSPSI